MYVCMYVSFVDHLAPSLIFFHLQWYEDSLTYLKHNYATSSISCYESCNSHNYVNVH